MIRERSELIQFSRDDIERIIRYVAKNRVADSLFVSKFGEQEVRWLPDGGMHVFTKFQEGDFADLPIGTSVPLTLADERPKKKSKK